MMTQTFEIKVALLGYVSVGKTTVLNALLQDKFSEVSMCRTTAGVNFFRVVNDISKAEEGSGVNGTAEAPKATAPEMVWSPHADEPVHTAASTLAEITQDNRVLREVKMVLEKTFNVELNEPLCEMRKDTSLVFVDIPGLNEAGSKKMYLNYVSQKWDTFDCVVIVMDAGKGVNTEEQVSLLEFVHRKLASDKSVPVIVLCNKVDDPDDDEVMELVGEVRTKVEQIFKVGDRTDSLKQLLTAYREGKRCNSQSLFPVFIPLSAGNAFAYRTAAKCSLEEFKSLDIKLIDKIGRDEVGKNKWKQLPLDEKYKIVFGVMRDAKQYQENLEATFFDKFLMVLSYCIGGPDVQLSLLERQLRVALRDLSECSFEIKQFGTLFYWCKAANQDVLPVRTSMGGLYVANQMQSILDSCKAVGCDPAPLKDAFWRVYENICKAAAVPLLTNVDPSVLADVLDELIAYGDLARKVGWKDEEQKVLEHASAFVRQLIGHVLAMESTWRIDYAVVAQRSRAQHSGFHNHSPLAGDRPKINRFEQPAIGFPWEWKLEAGTWTNVVTGETRLGAENPALVPVTWTTLTYHDWCTIVGSLLLLANSRHFYERFGREKIVLEKLFQRHSFYANCLMSGKCAIDCNAGKNSLAACANCCGKSTAEKNAMANIPKFTEGSYVNGKFVPKDPVKYNLVVQVVAPELISDRSHWGHVIWKYCKFMDQVEASVA